MYSWNDFINDFPYTNFSDINVSWFLNKFKQIFDEWEGLYNQMLSWKTATDEYNATWRTEQEQAFNTWETNFQNAIDTWKLQTENDITTWENTVLENLNTWKNAFITQYNELKAEVEQIEEEAETAKNSAQLSAQNAANSADSASATALALQASLNQINTNTNDISELKTQLKYDRQAVSADFVQGYISVGGVQPSERVVVSAKYLSKDNISVIKAENGCKLIVYGFDKPGQSGFLGYYTTDGVFSTIGTVAEFDEIYLNNFNAAFVRIGVYAYESGTRVDITPSSAAPYITFIQLLKVRVEENAEKINGAVEALTEQIEETFGEKYLYTELTNVVQGIVHPINVGSYLNFAPSNVTKAIVNIFHVESGKRYKIYVGQSETPAGIGDRSCVIVDDSNIIRQVNVYTIEAGVTSEIDFVASTNGNVVVCVDNNYTDIAAKEIIGEPNLFDGYPVNANSNLSKHEWKTGGITGGGFGSKSTNRITTKKLISYPQYEKVKSENGYLFNVSAYNKDTGAYVGKFSNGTFVNGIPQNISIFDLSVYPNYNYLISLMRPNDEEDITTDECVNCTFTTDFLKLADNISNVVGFDAKEKLAEVDTISRTTIVIPAIINPGDVIEIFASNIPGDTVPDVDLVVKTAKDGENVDTIIASVFSASVIDCVRSIVCTADANQIKVNSNTAGLKCAIYRNINRTPIQNTVEKVVDNERNINAIINSVDVIGGSNSYAINGESAIKTNMEYITDKKLKIVMLDNNYKYFSISNIKSIIDAMSQSGCNALMLGFGGSGRGLSFKLDDMTIVSYGIEYDLADCISTNFGNYYDETDMDEIITYANTNGIEIIPSFNMPGHFAPFLVKNQQFRLHGDANSINIDDPKARDYAYKIAEMYIKWFSEKGVKRWHFGADEFGDINSGYYALYSSGNYNYALFINEIAYIVSKYRMIPMAWNDAFGINDTVNPMLNRKIPILYWKLQQTNGASATEIEALGNPLINSSVNIYWVANGQKVTEQQMRAFNVTNYPDGSVINNTVGACFCIWIGKKESPALNDGGDAITTEVLPLIRAFGETVTPQFA